ncbi:MAG: glycosyltransferase [Crocinitomicaceae bacterium]|nr:glycosyltransferase [Crocinitomicaceae bacterium]
MTSSSRKRILILTDWYLPGFMAGGPIRSLANMVELIEHDFFIITRNTDLNSSVPYSGIETGKWNRFNDRCQIWYFEEKDISEEAMRNILLNGHFDWIYMNSLFSKKFTLLPMKILRREKMTHRVLLAPRGMLKEGALSVKPLKKKLFISMARMLGCFNGITWHATSESEREEIKRYFGSSSAIRVAPNLSLAPGQTVAGPEKISGEMKLISIARISPEKGISEAIAYVRDAGLKGNVVIDFYGTQQNKDYLDECKKLAAGINGITLRFPGHADAKDIFGLMSGYHFFYLPTKGENYGHAIAEALIASLPVLISDKTPWRNLEEVKAGWDLPLVSEEFAKMLRYCLLLGGDEYAIWRKGAGTIGKKIAQNAPSIEMNRHLFDFSPEYQ